VINDHLPIDLAGGGYCSNCKKFTKWQQSYSKERYAGVHHPASNIPIKELLVHV
jgi:hypothetical protein